MEEHFVFENLTQILGRFGSGNLPMNQSQMPPGMNPSSMPPPGVGRGAAMNVNTNNPMNKMMPPPGINNMQPNMTIQRTLSNSGPTSNTNQIPQQQQQQVPVNPQQQQQQGNQQPQQRFPMTNGLPSNFNPTPAELLNLMNQQQQQQKPASYTQAALSSLLSNAPGGPPPSPSKNPLAGSGSINKNDHEFSLVTEDFPALPGSSGQTPQPASYQPQVRFLFIGNYSNAHH